MKLSTGKIIYLVILLITIFFVGKNFTMNDTSKIDEVKTAIEASNIDTANNDKLVLYTNEITCDTVKDALFEVEVAAPVLTRSVEIYDYKLVGDEIVLGWDADEETLELTDADDNLLYTSDNKPAIRTNQPLRDTVTEAFSIKCGDASLDANLINTLDVKDTVYAPEDENKIINFNGSKYYYVDGYFTTCPEAGREIKGDVRLKYTYKDLTDVKEVSILAKQVGYKFEPYETEKGAKVYMMRNGKVSIDTFANDIAKKDASSKKTSVVVLVIVLVIGIFVFKNKGDNQTSDKVEKKETKTETNNINVETVDNTSEENKN